MFYEKHVKHDEVKTEMWSNIELKKIGYNGVCGVVDTSNTLHGNNKLTILFWYIYETFMTRRYYINWNSVGYMRIVKNMS